MHLHVLISLALVFLSHVTYTVAQRGPALATARKKVEFEFEPRDSREPEYVPRDSREPEDYGKGGINGDDGYDGDDSDDYVSLFLTINQIKKIYNLPEDVTVVCDKEDVPSISRSPGDAGKRNTSVCRLAGGEFFENSNPWKRCDRSPCCETCLTLVTRYQIPTVEGPWEFVAHDSKNGRHQVWWEASCGQHGNCKNCRLIETPQPVLVTDLDRTMLNARWRWYFRPAYCRCRNSYP